MEAQVIEKTCWRNCFQNNVLLLDTSVVSILFNRNHSLQQMCIEAVADHQLVISFMTRAELSLWPVANNWGASRRSPLEEHTALYLTTLSR